MSGTRPIGPHDYSRILAVIHALEMKAIGGEDGPMWELLRETHANYLSEDPPLPLDDLVGDAAVSREINHARIVLTDLTRGQTQTMATGVAPSQQRCANQDCNNLTYGRLCPQCELLGPE